VATIGHERIAVEVSMSSKRYEHKLLESNDRAEFEQQLSSVGASGWSVVGYGVLPDGSRSALLERKQHDDRRHHHGHHRERQRPERPARGADEPSPESRQP
jgi:hypothetical protein